MDSIKLNTLSTQFSYSKEKLFDRIMLISLLASFIILGINFLDLTIDNLFLTVVFLSVLLVSYTAFKLGYKILAYHLVVLGICISRIFVVSVYDISYFTQILLYPTALIFCFIFFDKTYVLIIYLVIFILSEYFLVQHFNQRYLAGNVIDLWAETINVIAYTAAIFAMCYYFIRSIKNYQDGLDLSRIELEKKEKYIQTQTDELEHKNQKMSEYIESNLQLENFAHLASHELKSPLRGVSNYASLLEMKAAKKLNEKELEYLSMIIENTKKMNFLIEDLTELGKITNTKIKNKAIDLNQFFDHLILSFHGDIKKVKTEISYDGHIKQINGHESLLAQLFTNLISNSIKFSKPDVTPVIRIESSIDKGFYVFAVHDNGIGIDDKYRKDIFKIYQRLHSEAEYKGSGIGLSICKKIVELHKGTIWVDHSYLGGTAFIVRLPIR